MVTSPVSIAKKVLLGTVYGDSSVSVHRGLINPTTKAMLTLTQGEDQFEYLLWKMHLLQPLVGNFHIKVNYSSSGKMVLHAVTKYDRYLWHIFNDYYVQIPTNTYPKNKKIIRMNVLRRMTPISFAMWYQDDGSLYTNGSRFKGVRLATYGFSYEENELIQNHLREWWKIDSVIDVRSWDGYPFIRFNKQDGEKFLEMVSPFMHPSMQYKTMQFSQSARHVIAHDEIVCSLQQCGELIRNNQSDMKSKYQIDWPTLVKGPIAKDIMRFRIA